jgi:hypothetical protein
MREKVVEPKLGKESVLKLDKDCHISSQLEREDVQNMRAILRRHHLRVLSIKATRTQHGNHYYIRIDPPVTAKTANELQYLLGSDAKRVAYSRGLIGRSSRFFAWNRLFEELGRRKVTLYRCRASGPRRTLPNFLE